MALGGCAVSREVPFNPADFARSAAPGSGKVTGQVYAILRNGRSLTADGEPVVVAPVNAYTTENIQRRYIGGEHLRSADSRIDQYLHTGTTDRDGNFTVRGIPPGEYYVESEVTWTTSRLETDNDGIESNMHVDHEKLVFSRITIRNGQVVRVTAWNQSNPVHDSFYSYGGSLVRPHHQLVDLCQ